MQGQTVFHVSLYMRYRTKTEKPADFQKDGWRAWPDGSLKFRRGLKNTKNAPKHWDHII